MTAYSHTGWVCSHVSVKVEKTAGQVLSQPTNFVHLCPLSTVMGHFVHSNMQRVSVLGHEQLPGSMTTRRGRGQ